jgi:hypothetical protein
VRLRYLERALVTAGEADLVAALVEDERLGEPSSSPSMTPNRVLPAVPPLATANSASVFPSSVTSPQRTSDTR